MKGRKIEDIYEKYSKLVYSYLLSLTKDSSIAEDLMQETFYSAIKNINKFRNESSLKVWLCKIAKNKWTDYYKKSKKTNEVNLDYLDETCFSSYFIEDNVINKQETLNVLKSIHNLDETSKEVIYLRIGMNLSFREIGMIMEKNENWARIIFYRAKIKLKEDLNNG